ncbi:hypothetical protein J6590_058921 [Homalodisca vitripennis]|nr:hypothetical protein J6590_058921 [Homalodisca vitripennis]
MSGEGPKTHQEHNFRSFLGESLMEQHTLTNCFWMNTARDRAQVAVLGPDRPGSEAYCHWLSHGGKSILAKMNISLHS